MKLGLNLGYAPPGTNPAELVPLVQEAERLGFDSVWTAEAWGTDAVTVLAYLAAKTETIKLGSAIMQIPGRTPTNTAMTAATLDLISGGRFLLGLTIVGAPVAFEMEKSKQREVFTNCMQERGYAITPAKNGQS